MDRPSKRAGTEVSLVNLASIPNIRESKLLKRFPKETAAPPKGEQGRALKDKLLLQGTPIRTRPASGTVKPIRACGLRSKTDRRHRNKTHNVCGFRKAQSPSERASVSPSPAKGERHTDYHTKTALRHRNKTRNAGGDVRKGPFPGHKFPLTREDTTR